MSLASVYVTTPDGETARNIARQLLEQKLAACVNILPGVTSMYWWDGEIQTGEEVALVAKTVMKNVRPIVAAVKEIHPDEVPCIVAYPILKANPDYGKWIEQITNEEE